VYSFGRADDPQVVERLRKLARSILRRCSPEEIVADDPSWRVEDAWPFGDIYVLERLWEQLGLGEIISRQARRRKLKFAAERALFAMIANRALAPCSKLYCWDRWLAADVRIAGTEELELQHLYRAMDFLEANKEEIEREIFFRVSDLLSLDVDLIFYDTTTLHSRSTRRTAARDPTNRSVAAGRPVGRSTRRRAGAGIRRTGVVMRRRSSSVSRLRATGCRCATGSSLATRST
jgi:hypothetical protein